MAKSLGDSLAYFLRSDALRTEEGVCDAELLGRFIERRDEIAWDALVRRHGPMVWGVCRRVLGHAQDAEDAFQATFIVLVRRATAVNPRGAVGNWLYGVARQTALKAKAMAVRRGVRERQVLVLPEVGVVTPDPTDDLRLLLDRELSRLPDNYRAAIVLCDLEGRSFKDAARILGWPEGTLSGRLSRARRMLADRMTRAGHVLPTGLVVLGIGGFATAGSVPTPVVAATIAAAWRVAAGQPMSGPTTAVTVLTQEVLRDMFMLKARLLACVLLAGGVMLTGVAVSARYAQVDPPAAPGGAGRPGAETPNALSSGAGQWQERVALRAESSGVGVWAVAFSPVSDVLAAAEGKTIKLWDTKTGKSLVSLSEHNNAVGSLAFSPDGKTLASAAGGDDSILLWDVGERKVRSRLKGHSTDVRAVAFSPDGKVLASSAHKFPDKSGEVKSWDVPTGRELATLKGSAGYVNGLSFSPDGKTLTTAGADGDEGAVTFWDLDGRGGAKERSTVKHPQRVHIVAFSPDGKVVASAGGDAIVRLLDPVTGQTRTELKGHEGNSAGLSFSPDGKRLASTGVRVTVAPAQYSGELKVWDIDSGKEQGGLPRDTLPPITSVAFSGDGKTLAVGHWASEPIRTKFVDGKVVRIGDTTGVVKLWEWAAKHSAKKSP